jgi:hypothetical protein
MLANHKIAIREQKMKTKALYTFFGMLLVAGMAATIYFGLAPRPIPKIKFSTFEAPLKLSQAIELRMREEIKNAGILAFGYQPEHPQQLEIIRQFLKVNVEPGLRYDVIVSEEGLGDLGAGFETAEKMNMKAQVEALAEGLKSARTAGKRVMLVLPSAFGTQLLRANLSDILKQKFQVALVSFSIVELLRSREAEKTVSVPCFVSDTGTDVAGTGALGCAILQQSRATYRKKTELGKKAGMMDQRGAADYLIFYESGLDAPNAQ